MSYKKSWKKEENFKKFAIFTHYVKDSSDKIEYRWT